MKRDGSGSGRSLQGQAKWARGALTSGRSPSMQAEAQVWARGLKWPWVFQPSSASATQPVSTSAACRSSFGRPLAHSALHMSAG